jgi:hypothetical protein
LSYLKISVDIRPLARVSGLSSSSSSIVSFTLPQYLLYILLDDSSMNGSSLSISFDKSKLIFFFLKLKVEELELSDKYSF